MTDYAIFLRGINVGGINIRMAELQEALVALPLTGVRTLLATGNVVCACNEGADIVRTMIQDRLRSSFGYNAWVVVLTRARLQEIVAACPYPPDDPAVHTYVTLASEPEILAELFTAAEALDAEQTRLGPEATAWLALKGGTLASPISKLSAKARYKNATTTRNLRTLLKIAAA